MFPGHVPVILKKKKKGGGNQDIPGVVFYGKFKNLDSGKKWENNNELLQPGGGI